MELTGYNYWIARYLQPVLIYNPFAGKIRRNPERILQRTTEALERGNLRPRVLATAAPGHASELARQAVAEKSDLILVLGGDGTIHETVNGMAHSQVPLGVLPAGTANVLAMELGIGSQLERAIERLGSCIGRRVALGKLCGEGGQSRFFLLMGGAGLDATIVADLHGPLKAKTGKLAYWVAGLSQIRRRVGQLDVEIQEQTYRCGFALASRVRNYGGDLEIASGASLLSDDFEVVLFEGSSPLRYAWYMLGVLVKRVQKMRGAHTIRTTRVELLGDAHIQVDGEYAGRLPASLEIVPDAITLLMPPAYR